MKQVSIVHPSLDLYLFICKGLWQNKTVWRSLLNYSLKKTKPISGEILDLGAGESGGSYYNYLNFKKPYQITKSDFYHTSKNTLKINLEKPFKLKKKYDSILCFNVFEHIFNFEKLSQSIYYNLKKGGIFIGASPFLFPYHPDPHDYFRYSHEAIYKLFIKRKFKAVKIISLGFGPFTLNLNNILFLYPKFLRPLFFTLAFSLDLFLNQFSQYYQFKKFRYSLGYLYIFQK